MSLSLALLLSTLPILNDCIDLLGIPLGLLDRQKVSMEHHVLLEGAELLMQREQLPISGIDMSIGAGGQLV